MKGLNAWLRNILIALIFAIPFIPFIVSSSMFFPFITGKNFTFRILTEILFAGWLILLFNHPEYRPRFNKLTIAVLSLLGILTLATVFGENPYKSFWSNFERMEGLVTHIHLAAYFLVASSLLSTTKLWRRFFQTSLIASVGMVFYALVQISGGAVINQGGVRVDATLGNATYLAVYVLFHIFFAIYFLITTRDQWLKWAYGLIGLANLFVLYKTATRGTILGLIGGIILFGLIMAWKGRGRVRQTAIGLILGVVVLVAGFVSVRDSAWVQSSPVLSRFAAISATETTTESRFLIWQMSWQGYKERPLLGWGPENYPKVFEKYYHPKMWRQEPWFDRSHNVFFDWLINAGVLGLAAYLSLFGLALWYLWRAEEKLEIKALITALLAAYFFHNIFVFDNLISYVLFYSVLAWLVVAYGAKDQAVGASKTNHPGHRSEDSASQYIFASMVVIMTFGVMYFVNIKPIQASQTLIKGIVPNNNPAVSFSEFQKALALNTFGNNEIREQLLIHAINWSSRPDVTPESRQEWLTFTGRQMEQAIKSGRQDDARSNLVFSGFLVRLGAADNAFYSQALEYLARAREMSPLKQSIIMQQSAIHAARNHAGDKEKAFDFAKEAFDLDQDYPEARKNYIVMAANVGKDDLVKELISGAKEGEVMTDERLVNIYFERRRFDKLLETWQQLAASAPDKLEYQTSLAAAYVKVGKRAEAIKVLKGVIANNPDQELNKQINYLIKEIEAGRDPSTD